MKLFFRSSDRLRRSLALSATLLSEIIKLSAELYKEDTKRLSFGLEDIEKFVKQILCVHKSAADLQKQAKDPKVKDDDLPAKLKLAERNYEKLAKQFLGFTKKYAKNFMEALEKFEKINFDLQTLLYREAKSFSHLSSKEAHYFRKLIVQNAQRARRESVKSNPSGDDTHAPKIKDMKELREYAAALYGRLSNVFRHINHIAEKVFIGSKSLERHVLNLDTVLHERSLRSSFSIGRRFKRAGIELRQLENQIKELEKLGLKKQSPDEYVHDDNIHQVIELHEKKAELVDKEMHREMILLKRINDTIVLANQRIEPIRKIKYNKRIDHQISHAAEVFEELFERTHHSFEQMEHMALHNRMDIQKIGRKLSPILDSRKTPHAFNASGLGPQPHLKKREHPEKDIVKLKDYNHSGNEDIREAA